MSQILSSYHITFVGKLVSEAQISNSGSDTDPTEQKSPQFQGIITNRHESIVIFYGCIGDGSLLTAQVAV